MRLSKLGLVLSAALISSALAAPAAASTLVPCKVLTAEKFSTIMGYTATIMKEASNESACWYEGPKGSGGQFRIISEVASGPQADAMLTRRGSSPPAGSGMIGGTYKQGTVIFSVNIKGDDKAKLDALVAEIRRSLK